MIDMLVVLVIRGKRTACKDNDELPIVNSRESIRKAVEDQLKELGLDCNGDPIKED